MKRIDRLLAEYGESHQNHTNKTIHWICVPLIFLSIVGLIASIPAGPLESLFGAASFFANWAVIVLILVTVYYLSLSVSLTVGMVLFALLCIFVTRAIPQLGVPLWLGSLAVFVLAWIGQFYGHQVEGKKPSFFKDLQFLLIGPAWLMHFIYKRIGIPY